MINRFTKSTSRLKKRSIRRSKKCKSRRLKKRSPDISKKCKSRRLKKRSPDRLNRLKKSKKSRSKKSKHTKSKKSKHTKSKKSKHTKSKKSKHTKFRKFKIIDSSLSAVSPLECVKIPQKITKKGKYPIARIIAINPQNIFSHTLVQIQLKQNCTISFGIFVPDNKNIIVSSLKKKTPVIRIPDIGYQIALKYKIPMKKFPEWELNDTQIQIVNRLFEKCESNKYFTHKYCSVTLFDAHYSLLANIIPNIFPGSGINCHYFTYLFVNDPKKLLNILQYNRSNLFN